MNSSIRNDEFYDKSFVMLVALSLVNEISQLRRTLAIVSTCINVHQICHEYALHRV